ncbi:MAG TPA: PASTA domain-containing protein [Solirubrobacteraceae bacterium]|nr:PASTA domain-containing protein [Solirubrobacteraceae bacterium]
MSRRGLPIPAWVARAALAALSVGGLAACGSPPPRPGPAVSLQLSNPADGTRTSAVTVTVSGRVHPVRATVLVLGRSVPVQADGSFSARVALGVGTNLIDVEASAPRSVGAVTALSVVRFLLVTVPNLGGESPSQASHALRALGLSVKLRGAADPFGFLLPTSDQVCSSEPGPGARLVPGTTVTLLTAKLCGF